MTMNGYRKKYLFSQLLLTVMVIILLFALVEGLFRLQYQIAIGDSLKITLPDGLRVLQPNLDTRVIGDAGTPIHVRTNSDGFATGEHSIVAPAHTYRIVFIGSSFTQGFQVDYDKRFPDLLERSLNEAARDRGESRRFEVLNFGMGAYSYPEQLLLYRKYVRQYHPDMVILQAYVGFDFSTNLRFLPQKDYILRTPLEKIDAAAIIAAPTETNEKKDLKTKLVERFEVLRYAIRLVRNNPILYQLAIRAGLLSKPFSKDVGNYLTDMWSYLDPTAEVQKNIMSFTGEMIARVGADAEKDGAKFAVLLVPSYWQVHDKYIEELREKKGGEIDLYLPNKIVAKELRDRYPLLDLSDPIARALNREKREVFINDVGHFTVYGHALAAREIEKFLEW